MTEAEAIKRAHAALRRASQAIHQQGRAIERLEQRVQRLERHVLDHESKTRAERELDDALADLPINER